MSRESKLQELADLKARVHALEAELASGSGSEHWQARGYYTAYYIVTGAMLGFVGGLVSLAANAIGSMLWSSVMHVDQHPLRLIQVYLTFPLGLDALKIDSGLLLSLGCFLYLMTGMVYGVAFQLVLTRFAPDASFWGRFAWASALGLLIWFVNFYGILVWLQPALLGGSWIVELVPPWVAAITHLVFGWTMAVIYPLGLYVPYRPPVESR